VHAPLQMSRAFRRYRPEAVVSALAVSAHRENLAFLGEVFRDANWNLIEAHSIAEAVRAVDQRRVVLVITERDLPDGGWRRLMEALKSKLASPAPLIVTARLADEYLWAEVLNEGGYDVLAQPLDPEEVVRVISAATRRVQNQARATVETIRSAALTA
jgi:DNA-binding response OmpR family regulator